MALSPQEQAALDALQAKAGAPEPRTHTGVTGVLHTLIDLASGALAHAGPEVFAQLHRQAEYGGDGQVPDGPASPSSAADAPAGG